MKRHALPNHKTAWWFLTCIAFLLAAGTARPEQDAPARPVLRLGVNDWFFWRSHQDGKFSGADVDVWREIAKRNNLEIAFTFIPDLEQLKTAMEEGSIDVFVGMLKTEEREKYMLFLEPPFRTKLEYVTYVKAGSKVVIAKHEDMREKKIAVMTNPFLYSRIASDSTIDKEAFGMDPAKAFDKLLAGKVDAVHLCDWQAIWFLRGGKLKEQIELADFTYREYHPIYMAMSKRSSFAKEWESLFGQTIRQMIDDGTMKRLVDSYIPDWYEYWERPFSMVYLAASYADTNTLTRQVKWIKENQERKNIRFVIHTGDLVHDGTEEEWRSANQCFRELDGIVPYGIATGNHDVFPGKGLPRDRNSKRYDSLFPPSRWQSNPFYAGHLGSSSENMLHAFHYGPNALRLLFLEFGVRDPALNWAGQVLKENQDQPVIVVTHAFTPSADSENNFSWHPMHLDRSNNDRDKVWEKLITKHPNIVLVLSAHNKGLRRERSMGDHGNLVNQVLASFLSEDEQTEGWLRLLTFFPEQDKLLFQTYSPVSDSYRRDPENEFEMRFSMSATK